MCVHVELDKAIDLNYNMECAAIVLCQQIAYVSDFQSIYTVYMIYDSTKASRTVANSLDHQGHKLRQIRLKNLPTCIISYYHGLLSFKMLLAPVL